VSREAAVASQVASLSPVGRLAQFFPGVTAVRMPVQVTGVSLRGSSVTEQSVVEFATAQEVLFASGLPLEFDDRIRLENNDGSLAAEAMVVAVQYHDGKTAVAARFVKKVNNWIIQP
jgi:hypothetical protein